MTFTASDFNVNSTNATAEQIAALNAALSYLQKSPTATTILQGMVEKNVTINVISNIKVGDGYNKNNTIDWLPGEALAVNDKSGVVIGIESAAVALIHEGAHATDANLAAHTADTSTVAEGFPDASEKYAVGQANLVAAELGEVQRPNYSGGYIDDANPTDHTITNADGTLSWQEQLLNGSVTVTRGTLAIGDIPTDNSAPAVQLSGMTVTVSNATISVSTGAQLTINGANDTLSVENGGSANIISSGSNTVTCGQTTQSISGNSSVACTNGTLDTKTFSGDGSLLNEVTTSTNTSGAQSINASGQGVRLNNLTSNDDVILGQGTTALLGGSGEKVQLSESDTVNVSNATIQIRDGNGTTTIVGSDNNISTSASLTVVDGDKNHIYADLDGLETHILGNNNTYQGQDGEQLTVTGDNNHIAAYEDPHIDINAGANTAIDAISSQVTLGAGASIQVISSVADVTSTSYARDSSGNLITTTKEYYQGSPDYPGITPINTTTTVTDSDGNVVSESGTYHSDGITIETTVTPNEDGSEEINRTYTDDADGHVTLDANITTDIYGSTSSLDYVFHGASGQVTSELTASFSEPGVAPSWTQTDYYDSGNIKTITDSSGANEVSTQYDESGNKTEIDSYSYADGGETISADYIHYGENGQISSEITSTSSNGIISAWTAKEYYDSGVIRSITNTVGEDQVTIQYDENGNKTEVDSYTDGALTEKDTYSGSGQLSDVWTPGSGDTDSSPSEPPAAPPDAPEPPTGGGGEGDYGDNWDDAGGLFGFAGNQSVINAELDRNIGSIAAKDLGTGDIAGATAAEAGRFQAREIANATATSGTGIAVDTGRKWTSDVITWSLSSNMGDQYDAEVQQAFSKWAAASGLAFEEVSGTSSADIQIGFSNLNTATTGIVGYTTLQGGNASIANATIQLENPDATALVAGTDGQLTYSGTDATLEQVLQHEIGHGLGLADDSDQESIMYYELTSSNRTLDSTDIAGIQALYSANGAPISDVAALGDNGGSSTAAGHGWANDRLNLLISGMAAFDPKAAGSTSFMREEHALLHGMLAASSTT